MTEAWILDLLKQAPAIGAIVAIVWMGMKWHERVASQWLSAIERIDQTGKDNAQQFVKAVMEIGEKCHASHEKVSTMFHEQSCKGQEVMMQIHAILGQIGVHMEHFARAEEKLSDAVRALSKS